MAKKRLSLSIRRNADTLIQQYNSDLRKILPTEMNLSIQAYYLALKDHSDRHGQRESLDRYLTRNGVDLNIIDTARESE